MPFGVGLCFWYNVTMENEEKKEDAQVLEERGFLRVFLPLRKALLYNFLGGMAWGLGVVLGATILMGTLLFLFDLLGEVPFIGSIIESIIEQSQKMNSFVE
ncbi:MAG: DUF5665 domain-containing protein [bacterium]|nr:DUF5665 domain-containing protein [bacterium]